MHYDLEEFYPEFSIEFKTIKKNSAEKAFVKYIFKVLNGKKYRDIDSFYMHNSNFYSFLENYIKEKGRTNTIAKLKTNVLSSHFGESLTEDDYQLIIRSIIKLTERKKKFDQENIKTTQVDNKEVTSYTNNNSSTYLINSSDKKIEDQLGEKQPDDESFQTTDPEKNAENMFKDLEKKQKQSLNLIPLRDIISDLDKLSEDEKGFVFKIVNNLEYVSNIQVDLNQRMYVDSKGNVSTIKRIDGEDTIYGGEENTKKAEANQKTLVLNNSGSIAA